MGEQPQEAPKVSKGQPSLRSSLLSASAVSVLLTLYLYCGGSPAIGPLSPSDHQGRALHSLPCWRLLHLHQKDVPKAWNVCVCVCACVLCVCALHVCVRVFHVCVCMCARVCPVCVPLCVCVCVYF